VKYGTPTVSGEINDLLSVSSKHTSDKKPHFVMREATADNQSFPTCLLAFYASGTTMLESMWSSMSSSMQLAQECLERNSDEEAAAAANTSSMEGLEKFAQTIDNSEFHSHFGLSKFIISRVSDYSFESH
jgi:hypothetical protein